MRPTLAEAFRRAIAKGRGLSPDGEAVTMARVVRIFSNGMLEVQAGTMVAIVPVAGEGLRMLRPGGQVAVGWQKGRPVVAIAHSAKRSGAPVPLPSLLEPVIEELLIAPDPESGAVEVWFRNFDQTTNLKLRASLDGDPVLAKWGTVDNTFLVMTGSHHFYIYRLSREEREILESEAEAELVRDEQPLDAGIVLGTVTKSYALSGETRYWTITLPAETMNEAASSALNAAGSVTGQPLVFTRGMVETTNPLVLITDIQLDANLDLLLVLSADMGRIIPAMPLTGTHLIEKADGSGALDIFGLGITDKATNSPDVAPPGFDFSTHALLVNATQGTVLHRTCAEPLVSELAAELHRLHTYSHASLGTVDQPTVFNQVGKNGVNLDAWSAGPSIPDFSYTGLLSGSVVTSAGIASHARSEFDAAKTPYLDLADVSPQFSLSPFTVGPNGTRATGFPTSHSVRAEFNRTTEWQPTGYKFSAVYLPRQSTTALGFLLVKVFRVVKASAVDGGTPSEGLFLHDLKTDAVTVLQPLTANFRSFSSQGITYRGSGVHFLPESAGAAVVVGFNGTHLLWVWNHQDTQSGPTVVDIMLTDVRSGTTAVVISGDGAVDDGAGHAVYDDALLTFLARNLKVLGPDAMYYPNDVDEDKGNQFVEAWDAESGAPTLAASVPDFPPVDSAVEDLAPLEDLPEGVTPNPPTTIAVNKGPSNVADLVETGVAVHVVQTDDLGDQLGEDATEELPA